MDPPGGRSNRGRPDADAGSSRLPRQLGRYAGHGLTIGLSTALFAWLGSLLDGRLGTEPLFVIVGSFLGMGAGFVSMYRHLVLEAEDGAGEESDGGPGGDGGAGGGTR